MTKTNTRAPQKCRTQQTTTIDDRDTRATNHGNGEHTGSGTWACTQVKGSEDENVNRSRENHSNIEKSRSDKDNRLTYNRERYNQTRPLTELRGLDTPTQTLVSLWLGAHRLRVLDDGIERREGEHSWSRQVEGAEQGEERQMQRIRVTQASHGEVGEGANCWWRDTKQFRKELLLFSFMPHGWGYIRST